MPQPSSLVIAKGTTEIAILPKMANRHGLIAGATGTGKTVTLRVMAEQFSAIGVPVFMADVKGDLSGLPFPPPGPMAGRRRFGSGMLEFAAMIRCGRRADHGGR